MSSLRRNRDFQILWAGQAVSTVGSRISGLAFPLLVLATTHSPSRAGLVGFANTLPYLFLYLPAGAVVDRFDRKRVMLVADGLRAAALASLGVALLAGASSFPQIALVAFVDGAAGVFFQLAESAALPQIVPKDQLPQAVAQNQARQQGAGVVAQPLGGFLFTIAHSVPFLFDAGSYAASFVSLLFVRPSFQEARERDGTRLRSEIAEGIVWLWRDRFLRASFALIAGTNFGHAALALALIVRARELGASATVVGGVLAIFSAGAVVGSIIAPWVQRTIQPSHLVIGAYWSWAVLTGALWLVREPLVLGVLCALQAVTGPSCNVVLAAYRYRVVPDRLLGRVGAAGSLVTWGTIPLGSLAAGYLIASIGANETFLVLAGVFVAVGIAAVSSPSIRRATMVV